MDLQAVYSLRIAICTCTPPLCSYTTFQNCSNSIYSCSDYSALFL